jgi:4-hydroxybenzoyl-CoA thioesterase
VVFQTGTQVRFAHVDGASIVFYPRYFEMLNGAVEDWFAQSLGMDFKTMHTERQIAVPTVKLEAEFLSPSELGDELTITISPREIGRTSCILDVLFSGDGRDRLQARVVLVCMDLTARRAVPWPAELRARMTAELPAPA